MQRGKNTTVFSILAVQSDTANDAVDLVGSLFATSGEEKSEKNNALQVDTLSKLGLVFVLVIR